MTQQQPYCQTTEMSDSDQRLWATLIHVGCLFLGILSPLIGYLVLKDRGMFIRHHAATALNFQITALIASIVAGLLCFIIIGFVLLPIIGVLMVVFPIIAAVAANKGELYTYPLALKLVN